MKAPDRRKLARYLVFAVVLTILCILEQTPYLLPEICHATPSLVLAAAIAMALNGTQELGAMGFGIAAGLLLDFEQGGPYGFHAAILAVLCYFMALLVRFFFQKNLLSALLLSMGSIAIVCILEWLFFYVIFGYGDAGYVLLQHTLPKAVYTLLASIPIYWMYRGLARLLRSRYQLG